MCKCETTFYLDLKQTVGMALDCLGGFHDNFIGPATWLGEMSDKLMGNKMPFTLCLKVI